MKEPTPELVKQFWKDGLEKFDIEQKDKKDSTTMEVVGGFLDLCRITDKDAFMERFTTTVCETIYTPFEIGVPGPDGLHSLWSQMRVFPHELKHVNQFRADPAGFVVGYAVKRSKRAASEAEAYAVDLETNFWRTGVLFDIPHRMSVLKSSYGCADTHVDFASDFLTIRGELILQGEIIAPEAEWFIDWCNEHCPELRAEIRPHGF